MNDIIRKKHTNEPGNKGEFGTHTHSSPEAGLGDGRPAPLETEVEFTWVQRDVIPSPRHRKPRDVYHEGLTTTAAMRHVTAEDAPVGFEVPTLDMSRPDGDEWVTHELREFDGKLYKRLTENDLVSRGDRNTTIPATTEQLERLARRTQRYIIEADTQEEAAAQAATRFDSYLAIDGEIWAAAGEPRYVIITFGLGGNHGGTGLFIDNHRNTNVMEESYFPADQYDEAVAYALEVARERGDTESIGRIKSSPRITVHNPALVAREWTPAHRISYPDPWETTPETFHTDREAFLEAINQIPGGIIHRNGVRTVNYEVMTERQQYDYKKLLEIGIQEGLL